LPEELVSLPLEDILKLADCICSNLASTEKLLPGERREVAVVFLDLCGFTELSGSVDSESLHRFTLGLMQALAGVVQAHGGYVDKFEGDRIMALFGATLAFENDCERAVACGLRMQEMIREVGAVLSRSGRQLSARAGISFGTVTVAPDPSGHLTATGEEVNIASRLEEVARPGAVLVSEKVWRRCSDLFEWEDLGGVRVRGVREPVRALTPIGPGSAQRQRWESAASLAEAPLAGRHEEFRKAMTLWEGPVVPRLNFRGGARHRVVRIVGEQGSGKTRFLNDFLSAASSSQCPAVILRGEVSSYGQAPLRFWSTLICQFLGVRWTAKYSLEEQSRIADLIRNDPRLATIPEPDRGRLASIGAGLAQTPDSGTDLEALQQSTRGALKSFVSAVSQSGPAWLAADDLQEMDPESVRALEFVVNNCDASSPLRILLSRRTPDPPGDDAWPDFHSNYSEIDTILLGPLGDGDLAAATAAMLGASSVEEVPPSVIRYLLAGARGNPRVLREMLMALVEGGFLEKEPGGWVLRVSDLVGMGLPSSLSGVVRSRIDQLPSGLRQALKTASVLGDEFQGAAYESLARTFEPRSDPVQELADLERMGFLSSRLSGDGTWFSFVSSLVRLASYETLLLSNRQLMHRRAAEVLEDLPGDEGPSWHAGLAFHLSEAGDLSRASEHALEAARGYLATDYRRTVEMATRAATWLDQCAGVERVPLLLEALMLMRKPIDSAGRIEEREALMLGALKLCTENSLMEARQEVLRMLAGLYSSCGRAAEAEKLYGDILRAGGGGEISRHQAETRLDYAGHIVRYGKAEAGIEMLLQAACEFEAMGLVEQVANATGNAGAAYLMRLRDPESARSYLERSLALYRSMGNRRGEATSLGLLGTMHGMAGRLDQSRTTLLEALRIWEEMGSRRGQAQVLSNLGSCSLEAGNLDEARSFFRRTLSLYREAGIRRGEAVALLNAGSLALLRADLSEAGELLDAALVAIRETGQRQFEMECLCHKGILELRTGNPDEALLRYSEALSIARSLGLARAAARELLFFRGELLAAGTDEALLGLPGWER
jgi:class 3 adenylate cyclase/tetratricopeptide (TPR) repeat protein